MRSFTVYFQVISLLVKRLYLKMVIMANIMKMMMIFNVVIRNVMDAEGFWIITITAIHQTMTLRFVQDCKRLVLTSEGVNRTGGSEWGLVSVTHNF